MCRRVIQRLEEIIDQSGKLPNGQKCKIMLTGARTSAIAACCVCCCSHSVVHATCEVAALTCATLHAGHSLGGALAHLAAYDITKAFPGNIVRCYTFGSPR
jgi:hypothetical protein